jgi:hypothetical protein
MAILGAVALIAVVGLAMSRVSNAAVLRVEPAEVRAGDTLELHVTRAPGTYGLLWRIDRRNNDSWEEVGYAFGGPGEWSPGEIKVGDLGSVVPLIGFESSATIPMEVGELPVGRYRIGQDFISEGAGTVEERSVWYWAQFEVID